MGQEANAKAEVMRVLRELHKIGVNTIRIYSSPDEREWSDSANYTNLLQWIEEWNTQNPDHGDPNRAMYYLVQLMPRDPK